MHPSFIQTCSGVALIVIIPEGVDTLYKANIERLDRGVIDETNSNGLTDIRKQQALPNEAAFKRGSLHQHDISGIGKLFSLSVHTQIGLALILGYLLMLLIDQLFSPQLNHVCCIRFWKRSSACIRCPISCQSSSNATGVDALSCVDQRQPSFTATLGLVFHSFADGLALGAAFALNQLQLEIILALAILLHKIPAAFGLGCYLIHEGFPRSQIRLHLLCFASATPIAALLTYLCLFSPTATSIDHDTLLRATARTGFALLLSGGTFLYAAASHILPELIHASEADSLNVSFSNPKASATMYNNGNEAASVSVSLSSSPPLSTEQRPSYMHYSSNQSVKQSNHIASHQHLPTQTLAPREVLVLTLGAIIPLLLSAVHSH